MNKAPKTIKLNDPFNSKIRSFDKTSIIYKAILNKIIAHAINIRLTIKPLKNRSNFVEIKTNAIIGKPITIYLIIVLNC